MLRAVAASRKSQQKGLIPAWLDSATGAQHDMGVLPHEVTLPHDVVASLHDPLVPHGAYPDR